ncbi:glycosyltransferase family A protein [Lacimicrobium alkaliphilum]|uniref:Glycosyltransferase 2-like domain-containing protein n=2 Tax=Lacimicrobium alkaliphilum TaxID=1526571 RepID=A0ABQ1RRB2_9ALTE|nr:glycosyltransferase family A protein [Lacimicrobium alkaliphilum]GGD76854.1 hypothetical protein GCM10011357_34880 [Lacimicrobium alkaliphilum]
MILCSVVIPTRNRPEVTTRAVKSIIDQKNSEICQIIVVDDNSDFDYEIPNLREQDSFIKLSEKSTAAHARNVGICSSQGNIVYLLDSDDYFIERDFLKDHDDVYGSGNLFYCDFESGRKKSQLPGEVRSSDYFNFIFNKYEGIANTSTLIFSKHLNVRFDPVLPKHQDWDFVYFNFIDKGMSLIKLRGEVYIDRGDKRSISRTRDSSRSNVWTGRDSTLINI